jgi:hypothetical protein
MKVWAIITFCSECDKLTPFIDGFCHYCNCHDPFGDPYDPDITEEEHEKNWQENKQKIQIK